jgi:YjjG family noncanonical pyrimidine nucleotidase
MEEGKYYRAVLFDADGTLLDYKRSESHALQNALASLGFDPRSVDCVSSYRAINKMLWDELEKGTLSSRELRVLRFAKLFEHIGVDADASAFSRMYLDFLSKTSFLLPHAAEVLEYLHKKYVLILVTNGFQEVQYSRLKRAEIIDYFDPIIISEEVGAKKPDEQFFTETFRRVGDIDRSGALLVGDSLSSDILGGVRYGIDTCWYNPEGVENNTEVSPNFEIRDLSDLYSIL